MSIELEHLCRPRRDPLLSAARGRAAERFLCPSCRRRQGRGGAGAAACAAGGGTRRRISQRGGARVAARARPAGRMAGAVSGQRPGHQRRCATSRLRLASIVAADPSARHVNFDWMEPARMVRDQYRPGPGAAAGPELAGTGAVLNTVVTGTTVTQLRDGIYLVDVVARATDEQRVSLATLRNFQVPLPNGRTVPLNQLASFDFDQEFPLIWRRDRVPDLDRAGRCGARRTARKRRRAARAGGRRTECRPAGRLPYRGRRHRRGEREVTGLGFCRRAADAVADDHLPDDPAAELQPPLLVLIVVPMG